jgi:hypothetical protein
VIAAPETEPLQTWSSSTSRLQVRFPISLLRRIDADVIEGFSTFRRGGIEVGGVLFGTHDAGSVTLAAVRPIACEHRFGPTFQLSDTDEEQLRELLARDPEVDAQLSGLEPVGWVHSHTRSSIDLTEQDAYLHTKYFGKPWQIALILRPEQLRPTRAAFYLPEEDGRLRPAAPEKTFELPSNSPIPTAVAEITAGDGVVTILTAPLEVDPPAQEAAPRRSRRFLIAACALVAGVLAAAVYTSVADGRSSTTPPDVGLRIVGVGEQLTFAWVPPEGAHGADLEIRDGVSEPQFVHLTAQQLSGGRLSYVRRAPDVNVRMRVYGSTTAPADYVASFLGPPVRKPAQFAGAETAPPAAAPVVPPAAIEEVAATAAAPPAPQQPLETQNRSRTNPVPVQPETSLLARAPIAQPQAIDIAPELVSAPASLGTAPRPWPAAAPPPVAVPAPVRIEQPPPPASGRAIWTGTLAPGATLTFERGRASSGFLSGKWPQHPARISAHVADLSDAGIVVYTRDATQRPRVGTSESPSARNGWNVTSWRWDENRGGAVRVLEAPGPQNGWNRLTVRGNGRKVSMLVLEWEELPSSPR